jgi:prepilin-type N-terminal cleavage/methylation domain-containing protein
MNFFKKHGQSGFSLMEVVVGAALLGVLSTAVVNQLQLANNSKKSSNQQAIINGLTDKIGVELSKQETCSLAANFKGKAITRVFNTGDSIYASDGTTALITVGSSYGRKDAGGNSAAASDVASVQVSDIRTSQSATDSNQMIIDISFTKQTGVLKTFSLPQKISIPISIIKNTITPTLIEFCYNDITNSIASAIRLSCQGNTSTYDSTKNPPYGACIRNVDNTSCPANQYIRKIEYDASTGQNIVKRTCAGLNLTCGAGQVISSFNNDGTVNCSYPLPNCAPGQLMVKSATGPYICLQTNTGCSGLNAIKSFNSDGTVTCARFYPPKTCTGLVTSISPDSVTCSSYIKPVTCPEGQWVTGFDASGQAYCGKFYNYPQSCGGGNGATGLDASGNLTCQQLKRRLYCNGTPSTRTYSDCTAAGGTVYNYGTTNAYCHLNASSCTGAFIPCLDYRSRGSASCTDTHSNCPTAVRSYYEPAMAFSNPVHATYVQCRNYVSYGRYACTHTTYPPVHTPIYEVGCY